MFCRCDGTCQGRPCAVPCQCSCVYNAVIPRLIALRRIRQPELRPNDEKLWRTHEEIARLRDQRREFTVVPRSGGILEVRPNFTAGAGAQPPSRNDTFGLPFGIPDDILARLIAQPDLNLLIGPQGINDMLAGEPPILLPPGVATNEPPLVTTPVPSAGRQRGTSGGIPVPLDMMNIQIDPTIDSLLAAAERLGISTSGPQMGSSLGT
ncbi:hypothetical protein DPMN_031402 [Dreissena polymorpha]|uniref:Uncharacterized protein n=1 Tax=Dreissena polymorpha TaxID=45954 RepID=A0A9D4RH31_DREPO|nr:hypothetical protein DPMN_031402 [Dreissena polymorpha]